MFKLLKTRQFWLRVLRDLIILVSVVYIYNLYQTRNIPDVAPALNAQLISGEFVELSQMVKGSPVLIYFWGSWCPVCSITSATVTELSKEHQVLTIALSSGNQQQVERHLQENSYQFPVINDPDGKISQTWRVSVTPTFFIINRKGEVSSVTMGISSTWGLKIRLWLAAINE